MTRILTLLAILAVLQGPVSAQYSIQVRVDSVQTRKAFLLDYIGMKNNLVDSAKISPDGSFSFTLPATAHPGMYRIVIGPNSFWDIIFNREQIRMRTHFAAIIDSLKVLESKENQLLNRYMQYFVGISRKAELLQRLAGLYPPGEPFHQQIVKELNNLKAADPDQVSRDIIAKNPGTYVSGFLQLELAPIVPAGIAPKDQLVYIIEHFWENVNFTDTTMMYGPALSNKVRTYFTRLLPQAYPPANLEQAMKKGLDKLMSLAAINMVIFDFLLDDIADWAERSEFDDFFSYLTESYLAQASCTDEKRAGKIGDMVESYQKTAIGKQVPEIVIPREKNGALMLSEIPSKYVLVVFWASWCPHCSQLLPELKKLYDRYERSDLEIVAISLDQKRNEWEQAIKSNGYDWINHSELKGWDCSIAYDYGIRATPTLILVDKKRTVVAKPRNASALEQKLFELGIKPVKQ